MCKLMIIDDEEVLREVLDSYLSSQGHMCTLAKNGREGLEILNREKFDAIITDVMMPEMDGLTMIQELLKRQFTDPVMIMTGGGTIDCREKALQAGAKGFVSKPFSLQEFLKELYRMIRGHSGDGFCVGRGTPQQASIGMNQ